jgi:glycosyltransferase involved in cell wall biosynthesis
MISIVIPYMHDAWRLKLLMASLQTMPGKDVEICVVEVGKSQHISEDDFEHEAQIKYKFVWNERPFNRAWVMNLGVKHLSQGEILVLSDADLVFSPEWAALMYETKYPVVAWSRLHVLDRAATEEYLRTGVRSRADRIWRPDPRVACGGVSIIPRDVYYETCGMVEYFEGWGGEDNASWARLVAFGYPFGYIDCDVWHLWHHPTNPPGPRPWHAYMMLNWTKEDWVKYMDGGWGDLSGARTDLGALNVDRTALQPVFANQGGADANSRRALGQDASRSALLNDLGLAYVNEGMYDQGVAALREALAIAPDFASAHMNLGMAYTKLGMFDEAVEELEHALRLNSDFAKAHYNLAITHYKKGNYREAVKHCDRAVALGAEVHPQLLESLKPYR